MMFGKTYEQKREDDIKRREELADKRFKKFSFLPRKLNDGRIAWLQYIYVQYVYSNPCPYSGNLVYEELEYPSLFATPEENKT